MTAYQTVETSNGNFQAFPRRSPKRRPPVPPFTLESAVQKVRLAEDAWNSRDPIKVAMAYSRETTWRDRAEFVIGRAAAEALLARKWTREFNYRMIQDLWAFTDHRIAVRIAYEYHDDSGTWFRAYGNENWEFDSHGLIAHRHASINEQPITEIDRLFIWPIGRRPDEYPGLSELGL
jgi:hypothetical protein